MLPRKKRIDSISDINVTPFVDVLLVLLIIFMITAPLMTKSMDVQLPQEQLKTPSPQDATSLIITLRRNGTYWIESRRLSKNKLLSKVIAWKRKNPNRSVFIKADRKAEYGRITRLMVLLKNSGIHQIGLLVEDRG